MPLPGVFANVYLISTVGFQTCGERALEMTMRRGRKPYGFRSKNGTGIRSGKRTLSKAKRGFRKHAYSKNGAYDFCHERVDTGNFQKDISFTVHKQTVSFNVSNFENFYIPDRHS